MQYGETVVLVAAAHSSPRPGIDFFPLTCDYRERHAAAGKFPGGFLKREGRPTTKETLTSRLMDRPIRPMFTEGFMDEVQIQAFVMSSDRQTDGDILAMNGASAALAISHLPFHGPLGSVRLGLVDGEFIAFPTADELEVSELDMIVSGTRDAILMIEGFSREMPEERMAEALMEAHKYVVALCDLQLELVAKVQPEKMDFQTPPSDGLWEKLCEQFYNKLHAAKQTEGKQARADASRAVKEEALAATYSRPQGRGRVYHVVVRQELARSGREGDARPRFLPVRGRMAATLSRCVRLSARWTCCRVCMVRLSSNAAKHKRS